MVSRVLGLLNKRLTGLHETALLLIISTLASQILGLVRDRLLAHSFGASRTLDIYYAAFKVPDFLFVTFASLVSLTVLIPFLSRYLAQDDQEGARRFMDSLISGFLFIMLIASAVAFLLMPWLVRLIAPGFNAAEISQCVLLSRILLLSPIFLGLSNHLGSITQSFRKFFVYALTPLLYNVGIIIGITVFYPAMGVSGLVWGVVLGALAQSLIQLPAIAESGFMPRLRLRIDFAAIKEVVRVCVPRTLGLSTTQIFLIVITAIATTLSVGSVAVFNFAYNLQSVLLAFGVSYSMAAFATQSKLFASGDIKGFVAETASAARQIIFWSIPATALFIVLRAQIVRTILGSGQFDWTSTRLVAASLGMFAVSIVAQGLVLLFVRAYFASGATKKPLFINVISSGLGIVFAFVLIPLFQSHELFRDFVEALFRVSGVPGTTILMLPLAFTLGSVLNAALHWFYFEKDFGNFSKDVLRTFWHALSAGVFSGAVAYIVLTILGTRLDLDTFKGIFTQGLLAGIAGIIGGLLLLVALKNKELADFTRALHSKFWKEKPIMPGPEELHP